MKPTNKIITICILPLIITCFTFNTNAQFNRDPYESGANAPQKDSVFFDYDMLNKYIESALENNPKAKIGELRTKVTLQDVRLAKFSWTKDLSGQLNLNQINAPEWGIGTNKGGTSSNAFFPLYGFSLRFTAGTFVLTPMEVKRANQLHKIALTDKENQNSILIQEVIQSYQNYVLRQKSLFLKLEIETKFYSLYGFVSKNQNSKDLAVLEKEAQIFNSYTQALEARNTAEAELRLAKFELESLIGTKLESIKK